MRNGYRDSFGVTKDAWIEDRRAGAAWRLVARSTRQRPVSLDGLAGLLASHLGPGEEDWQLDRGPHGDHLDDLEADLVRDVLVFAWNQAPPLIGEEEALTVLSDDPTCTPEGLMRLMDRCGALLPIDAGQGQFAEFGNPPAMSRPHEVTRFDPKKPLVGIDVMDPRLFDPPKFNPMDLRTVVASKSEDWQYPAEERHLLIDDIRLEIEDIYSRYLEYDRENLLAQPPGRRIRSVSLRNGEGERTPDRYTRLLIVPWAAAWRTYRLLHLAMSALIRLAAPATPRLAATAMREEETRALANRNLPVTCDGWVETGSPLTEVQSRMVLDQQRGHPADDEDRERLAPLRDLLPAHGELVCPGILQSLFLARGFLPVNQSEALALFVTETINAALPVDTAGARFAAASRPVPQENCASLLASQMVRLFAELDEHPLHVCANGKCGKLFIRQGGARKRAARPGLPSREVTPVSRHGTGVIFCTPSCGTNSRVARKRARDKGQ